MYAENRNAAPLTIKQTGGTEGEPIVSPPLFMTTHATQDDVDASGNRIIVVSGASAAVAYVQMAISSHIHPETGDGGAWATLMRYDQLDIVNGQVTFGSAVHDAAFSISLPGPVRALRLVSWGGDVRLEVAS